jgi:hypothetical protein
MNVPLRLALAASGWVALAATALPAASPVRVAVAFAFLLICPGAAAVRLADALLRRRGLRIDPLEGFVLTIALSLAAGALVAEVFFLTANFTMDRALVVLAGLTSVAALVPVGEGRAQRASWNGGHRRRTVPTKELR